jgi:hypothetical protein
MTQTSKEKRARFLKWLTGEYLGKFEGESLDEWLDLVVADADRCAELEHKMEQCSLDNECYVCPPLRCGTFKRGPIACNPLKTAEWKIALLQAVADAARAHRRVERGEVTLYPGKDRDSFTRELDSALDVLDNDGDFRPDGSPDD